MVKTAQPSASGDADVGLRDDIPAKPPARSSTRARKSSSVRVPPDPLSHEADAALLLRLAENAGNMGHWYADLATGTVTWSAQVFSIFGVDARTFAPDLHAILSICHPDDRARIEEIMKDAIAGWEDFEFDCRVARPDGSWRTIISTGQMESDAAGNVTALFGVVNDVTETFDAFRAIQDQNEMLDLAAHLAHLGHWIWTRDEDRLSFCSEEMARIHGMASGTFMRQFTHPSLFASVVLEGYRDHYRDTVTNALARGVPYEIEYRIKTRRGIVKDLREIGQPIFDSDGRLTRFIATAQDMTEIKQRENELREARACVEAQAEALRQSEEELKRKTEELQRPTCRRTSCSRSSPMTLEVRSTASLASLIFW